MFESVRPKAFQFGRRTTPMAVWPWMRAVTISACTRRFLYESVLVLLRLCACFVCVCAFFVSVLVCAFVESGWAAVLRVSLTELVVAIDFLFSKRDDIIINKDCIVREFLWNLFVVYIFFGFHACLLVHVYINEVYGHWDLIKLRLNITFSS